ncbi:pyridoxamine kinase [Mitsuokella sp.]|uniref:pyridoxamine kinase n=1 Tax=Mitsuokella TaxID=52225 RepID=UPI0029E26B77|nr:pyridoxamine kinase [Mitsuokella sp.]MDD6383547.1 pyridoxamine kinase [Selenomonadaceae bacterium]MDY4475043.1 pyridoxamine kinase [Mitsuokella sp.]
MKRQKRIALVNDITGFGRCSVTVELPLISAMKIQACPLPTAILSVHTGFPDHYLDDYTARMEPYMASWQRNHLEFDGICTGFLGSAEQIGIVLDFIQRFKRPGTRVMVDPVMGDYGKLYPSYTQEMCNKMRDLLQVADLVTPNLTEACQLLNVPYPQDGEVSDEELHEMAAALAARGPRQIVITGLHDADTIKNFLYEDGRTAIVRADKIGGDRSGSGDAFAAIVAASLVRGERLGQAVQRAADFISRCLSYAVELDLPWNYGLPFEEYLTELR